ncbi:MULTISPECIES: DUF190 domain-containing protein [unclassified Pseudodesulfovibrio]|uniref:DUF190 domain-containing protein n=1 Tax=unclassified Pseudodesulfovibrio TaxID=2661612 RepID=UPI000FEBE4B8|nr:MULTISPECIES: DUF190 domain-containing protein [unclassified Pseudodesulfovibrio]MCJ2163668.1 DUF190 domain-containing protein [Pseudodesulfovibrio sp. S3-i]RWU06073.1 DUF190 domain-containing protein [Pseudodesulfovibrio sp. S3]
MKLLEKAERIRIYIGEDDKHKGVPLAEAIVREARKLGLAGATVYRGLIGFGANSRIHTSKILRLSEGLPVVVEIVDHPDQLSPLLELLDTMVMEGMVTREPVDVIAYRHS